MLKGRLPLVVAGLLALLAGVFVWRYLEEKKLEIRKGWNLRQIVVAAREMPEGTIVSTDDVSQREVPEQFVTDSVITPENYNYIINQKISVPVKRGDPILWTQFQQNKGFERLSSVVQQRGRAVSISVTEQASVSQYVHPNDHVDIIGTFRDEETRQLISLTVLQDVIVLATGKITGNTNVNLLDERDKSYQTVTMLLDPEEAEILMLAQEVGTLYLSLRNSDDISKVEPHGHATIKTITDGIRMNQIADRRPKPQGIQIMKGNDKGGGH